MLESPLKPMKIAPDTAAPAEDQPDFDRGLFVCEKPGLEFSSAERSGLLVQLVTTQAFATLFLIPAAVFFILRNLAGASTLLTILATVLVAIPLLILGIITLTRLNTNTKKTGAYLKSETDSRYRIRAVIPSKRQSTGVRQWAEATLGTKPPEYTPPLSPDELGFIQGGFEPLIIRPWFGVKHAKAYQRTAIICGITCVGALLYIFQLFSGGWGPMFQTMGFLGYAAAGFAMLSGVVCAELIFPTYIRLAPGRLDIFRYGFLGSGQPEVTTYDLRRIGLCVDFGSFTIALEPPRPPGEPLPEFVVRKNSGVHAKIKVHPEGHTPDYFCLALTPNRIEHCQRLIQAARTNEPTPDLPDNQLLG